MDPFEDLLDAFGKKLDLILKPDALRSVRLRIFDDFHVQIEQDKTLKNILFGCELGTIPAGSYRKNIFTQAMIINGFHNEYRGTLAFSKKKESLILFQFLPIKNMEADRLYEYFRQFIDHAKIWITALREGAVPQIEGEKWIAQK